MAVIRVRGEQTELSEERAAGDRVLAEDGGLQLEPKGAAIVTPAGRAGGAPVDFELGDDDVVEYRDANGWVEFRTVRSIREGASTQRGGSGGVIDLAAALGPDSASRGMRDLRDVRAYTPKFPDAIREHLNLLDSLKGKVIDLAAQAAMRRAATAVVEWAERPSDGENKARTSGVYRIGPDLHLGDGTRLRDGDELEGGDAPHLVLIHGTFSSTEGGFNKFRDTPEWAAICGMYDGRMAALEHKTLSINPAVNALDLVRHLPKKSKLHLVTHSRGGLVGEVLSLAASGDLDPARFVRKSSDLADEERDILMRLVVEVAKREIEIERFVRVACPARGTILASPRLDQYAGYLFNVIEKIPGAAGWLFTILKTLTLAFLDQRTDPSVIPGLEAQMPGSPFVHLVNSAGRRVTDDLAAIAGDVEPGRWFKWLAIKATDLFYRQDHDLVVDTRSMYQGALRSTAAVAFFQDREVNHFKYFENDDSRRAVRNWLARDPDSTELPAGFSKVDRDAPKLVAQKGRRDVAADAPVVVVVPGMMGTSLGSDGVVVWPMAAHIATEGVSSFGTTAELEPVELLGATYQGLVDSLAAEFEVHEFPYDWRTSMAATAGRLEGVVNDLLQGERRVHIVAHSTGGLVVRQMLRGEGTESLWPQHHNAGRLLLLGCPNLGSYHALRIATGDADLIHRLHLLDPASSPRQIALQFRHYASLLETFPIDGEFRTDAWWALGGIQWADATESLKDAKRILDTAWFDSDKTIAIAGFGAETPIRAEVSAAGFEYHACDAGDGVVTVESAAAHPGPTYYVTASHGELPSDPDALAGYLDLLRSGETRHLTSKTPVQSEAVTPMRDGAERQLFPTSLDLEEAALGRIVGVELRTAPPVLNVEVVHGDLVFADFPVMVGHYDGSTIEGAEKALDWALGWRLTDRDVLGVYPGRVGTAEVVAAGPGGQPSGGIVVGLGEIGAVNAIKVAQGVTEGALRQAMDELSRVMPARSMSGNGDGPVETFGVGIATVLVGTNGPAGLSIENSVAAIVRGVEDANRLLSERGLARRVRIDRVQIVELYEDLAVEATHALNRLSAERKRATSSRVGRLVVAGVLGERENGRTGQPPPRYQKGDWRPIMVESVLWCDEPECLPLHDDDAGKQDGPGSDRGPKPDKAGEGGASRNGVGSRPAPPRARPARRDLSFKSIGLLARAEQTVHAGQRDHIDKLIESAVGRFTPDEQTYNTLFELLLPNSLKGVTRESDNLLLVLDSEATRYPWEMLAVRNRGGQIEPLSVQGGMLRRLLTPNFKDFVRATGNRALVIGDPPTDGWLPQLGGARAEAESVVSRLEDARFEVTSLIPAGERDVTDIGVLNALFAHEYRIIHVAAHGVYEPDDPTRSGIVIGQNSVLTPLVMGQLQRIPPLVFMNCCHLAQVDTRYPNDLTGRYHEFAASVSQQLIENGVRAVVAAGWAVDDHAAKDFADEFYAQMLGGAAFGDAVHEARRRIRRDHPDVNTWGAYQCYGDPGFKLVSKDQVAEGDESLVAAVELERRLESIEHKASSVTPRGVAAIKKQIEPLLTDYPAWSSGKIMNAAGSALAALGDFEQAVDVYGRALADWKADAPLRLIEQLANLEGRLAVQLYKQGSRDTDRIKTLIDSDRKRNELLLEMVGRTPERCRNLAAHYRRRAMVNRRRSSRTSALIAAAAHYDEARQMHLPVADPDTSINWGVLRVLAAESSLKKAERDEIRTVVEACLEEAERRLKTKPEFWNRVAKPDAEILFGLLAGDLPARAETIVTGYSTAFGRSSTVQERASVASHLDFLVEMLTWRELQAAADVLAGIMERLGLPDNLEAEDEPEAETG